MFVVQINGTDASSHSQQEDADRQRDIFVASGIAANAVVIIEKENFTPVNTGL